MERSLASADRKFWKLKNIKMYNSFSFNASATYHRGFCENAKNMANLLPKYLQFFAPLDSVILILGEKIRQAYTIK